MANSPLVRIDVHDDKVLMTEFVGQGDLAKVRTISPDGLAQALITNFKLDTGIQPTVHGVIRYVKHNQNLLLYYQVPEHRRQLVYNDMSHGVYPNCIVPWSVFVLQLRQQADGTYHLDHSAVYAAKGPILMATDQLYRYPLTNVDGNGRICHGTHAMPTTWRNIAGVSGYAEQFFASNFNAHLEEDQFIPTTLTIKGKTVRIDRVHSLMQYMNEAEHFPYEVLRAYKSFATLHQEVEKGLR